MQSKAFQKNAALSQPDMLIFILKCNGAILKVFETPIALKGVIQCHANA